MTLHPAHDIRNPHGARLARHRDAVGGMNQARLTGRDSSNDGRL